MRWIEANPLPVECNGCTQQTCYNCDNAGRRLFLSKKDELLMRRRMLEKAILRAERQIEEIDKELANIKSF